MIRTTRLALHLLFLAGLVLAACGPKATPEPTPTFPPSETPVPTPTATPTPPPEPATITLWHTWEGEALEQAQAAFADYMALHPGVQVVLEHVPDLANRVLSAIPAGEGPDILAWSSEHLGRMAEMGLIRPLEGWVAPAYLEEHYEPVALQAVTYKGKVWALPASLETLTLVYNRALVAEGDLPRDTEELLARAQAWGAEHPGTFYFAYNARNDVEFAAPWIYGAGGYYIAEGPSVGLNTPGGLAGLELIARFREVMPDQVDHATVGALFKEGKVALTVGGPWMLPDLDQAGLDFGLALLPIVSSSGMRARPLVRVQCLMLTPNSAHPSLALDVMRYYTSPEVSARLAQARGTIPANRLANESRALQDLPRVQAFVQQARFGAPWPATPAMAAVWDPVAKMLEAVWKGSAAPAEAVQSAQEQAEATLRSLGMEPQAPREGFTPGPVKEFEPIPVAEPVEITLWHAWPREYQEAAQATLDAYTAMSPQVTFQVVRVPDLPQKVLEAVPAGEGPDIIAFANEWLGRFADQGVIIPLDGYVDRAAWEASFLPPAVEAVAYRGHLWGFPDTVKAITLIYNKEKLTEAEVPRETDELLALGKRWREEHPGGYLLVYNARSDAYFSAPWWHAAGVRFVDEAGTVGFSTPSGVVAAQFLQALREIMPEEVDYSIADRLFREGKAAMTVSGPWYLPGLRSAGLDYGLAFLPTFSPTGRPGAPFVGVEALMVTASSRHPEVAVDVLRWFASPPAQVARTTAAGTVPSHREALADASVRALPDVQHFAEQARRGVALPPTPYLSALWDPVAKGLEMLWTGLATPEEAVRLIQERAERAIQEMR